MAAALFTIGRLAEDAGVGVETIRFYERKGLVQKPKLGRTSFREYAKEDVARVKFVKRAQELGFTLREVKELLALEKNSRVRCSDLKDRVDAKLTEVDAKIEDLRQMKAALKKLSSACDVGAASVKECRISDSFENKCC